MNILKYCEFYSKFKFLVWRKPKNSIINQRWEFDHSRSVIYGIWINKKSQNFTYSQTKTIKQHFGVQIIDTGIRYELLNFLKYCDFYSNFNFWSWGERRIQLSFKDDSLIIQYLSFTAIESTIKSKFHFFTDKYDHTRLRSWNNYNQHMVGISELFEILRILLKIPIFSLKKAEELNYHSKMTI